MLFKKIKLFILDILFPIECLGCGRENIWFCDECISKIKFSLIEKCAACKKPSPWGITHNNCRSETVLDGLIIAATFEDKLLKKIIHKFKYNFIENLAYPLSEILVQKILDLKNKKGNPNWVSLFWETKPLLMPVPLHQKRERWRGFNQAERLGLNIANRLGLEFKNDLLTRVKNTKPQAKFNKQKRLKNIKGAFGINSALSDQIKNTNILLVDDVFTTGVTMNECARVLKINGASKVWGIVLARG